VGLFSAEISIFSVAQDSQECFLRYFDVQASGALPRFCFSQFLVRVMSPPQHG
jgi:hypothetical protein